MKPFLSQRTWLNTLVMVYMSVGNNRKAWLKDTDVLSRKQKRLQAEVLFTFSEDAGSTLALPSYIAHTPRRSAQVAAFLRRARCNARIQWQ